MVGISGFWISNTLLGESSQVESAKIILRSHHGLRYARVPPSRPAENWLRQMRPGGPRNGWYTWVTYIICHWVTYLSIIII